MAGLGGDQVKPLPAAEPRLDTVPLALASESLRALILRLCASAWFLVLSATSFRDVNGLLEAIAAGRAGPGAWPALIADVCVVLFYTIIGCIIVLRPEPVSRAKGLGPVLLTLAGTYAAWFIPLLPSGPELPVLYVASAAILLVSEALILGLVVQPDPTGAQARHQRPLRHRPASALSGRGGRGCRHIVAIRMVGGSAVPDPACDRADQADATRRKGPSKGFSGLRRICAENVAPYSRRVVIIYK